MAKMALSSSLAGEKLRGIREVLGCLSSQPIEVAEALRDLADVLLWCGEATEDGLRNSCFSNGLVKAVLGILRSCSAVSMLATAARCLALLTHGNDEARIKLGELGAIQVLLNLLLPRPRGRKASPLWPKEWIPLYEQALMCLRKLTYLNMSNQQRLAMAGGVKLVVELAMDKSLLTNYGEFCPKAKRALETLVLRKKMISRVKPVPKDEIPATLRSFPALSSSLSIHYPAFLVELVTEGGSWVAQTLLEKGVVWLDQSPVPDGVKWTHVEVQHVEDGCNVWCQFCTSNPSNGVVNMRKSLQELVCALQSPSLSPHTHTTTNHRLFLLNCPPHSQPTANCKPPLSGSPYSFHMQFPHNSG